MPQCSRCGATKPKGEFYRSASAANGCRSECKECSRKDDARPAYRERRRKYATSKKGRKANGKAVKRYVESNPKKRACHEAVRHALVDGELVNPGVCETCDTATKLYAHHDDYDRPLDVSWLCFTCHVNWHIQNGEGANASPSTTPGEFPDIDVPGF